MSNDQNSIFTTDSKFASERELLQRQISEANISEKERYEICTRAADLVTRIREENASGLMEHFLAEYGLSTTEGVALMCLAEAMLRVPDNETIDALIEDKIAPSDWGKHLGEASSTLVNASTWALMLTGRILDDEQPGIAGVLRAAVKRVGEPVIRVAVGRVMKEMGGQFVLGESISDALSRARKMEKSGYTYSYDMLGEAALTTDDAARYAKSYSDAIDVIADVCNKQTVEENPGISIKLSALHPRYEVSQEARVMEELVPIVSELAHKAKAAGMGFNIDAEEQDRLVLSLKVIEAVLSDENLAGWNGFGVVVQAYGKRAGLTLDWLYRLAERLDRKIMVRLVKGAYWDTEMKLAQVEGLQDFSLFTNKSATDVSYITNAAKLFGYSDRIYPQFATHNAHTVAAILELAKGRPFEFQRLHGMGEGLHDLVIKETKGRCRIYAPVGTHKDLLAYLVRRLLENGANSSFVHQILDEEISPLEIASDPFEGVGQFVSTAGLSHPSEIFGLDRTNSKGFDLTNVQTLEVIDTARDIDIPNAFPITVSKATGQSRTITNPSNGEEIGSVLDADEETVNQAIKDTKPWRASVETRSAVLRKTADLYEENFGLIFGVLAKEAGKTLNDAVGELREAVDFLRYYADQAEVHTGDAVGIFTAISPWNFPLAIFTGQICAALATGNGVLAKPAEQTPIIATIAVDLMHKAGVPKESLQLLTGAGSTVGTALTSDPKINGVVFTGSTDTALRIRSTMAKNLAPNAPLIAETGGLNAMIVDSTALPEQAVQDIVDSAFQSAGQRCSALRCLYIQSDIAEPFIKMIKGAMDNLSINDPWHLATDVGPVIDASAQENILNYFNEHSGNILHQMSAPEFGTFVPPTLISVSGIQDLNREVFGPVLHVATFEAEELDDVVTQVNKKGFGLTFGLHTRIDGRVQEVSDKVHVGNLYVNRNQIGAVVGSQPFGGEGLSGTGPKAGGPLYLTRFVKAEEMSKSDDWEHELDVQTLEAELDDASSPKLLSKKELPGPTGEANILSQYARGPILCLGPGANAAKEQAALVRALGGIAVVAKGSLPAKQLSSLKGFEAVIWWGENARDYAISLSERTGQIIPLITSKPDLAHVVHERHLCIDTTAAGGNAKLLAG